MPVTLERLDGLQILIAEDEDDIRILLTALLEFAGGVVESVDDGTGVLEYLKSGKRPHVIITDITMKRLNGLELVDILQGDVHTKSIPVVVLTADVRYETQQRAMEKGAVFFEKKPLEAVTFVARFRAMIGDIPHIKAILEPV